MLRTEEQTFLPSQTYSEDIEDKALEKDLWKDKKFLPHIRYKNSAYIVQCSRHQWSWLTSSLNLGVKCLNVKNIKREIIHAPVCRILESGSTGLYIILWFSLKGKKPHITAHPGFADRISSLSCSIYSSGKKKTQTGGRVEWRPFPVMHKSWVIIPAQRVGDLQGHTPASIAQGKHTAPQDSWSLSLLLKLYFLMVIF